MQVDLSPHIEWMSEWMNEWMAIWMEAAVMQSIRVGGATRRAFYNGTLAFGATKSVTVYEKCTWFSWLTFKKIQCLKPSKVCLNYLLKRCAVIYCDENFYLFVSLICILNETRGSKPMHERLRQISQKVYKSYQLIAYFIALEITDLFWQNLKL